MYVGSVVLFSYGHLHVDTSGAHNGIASWRSLPLNGPVVRYEKNIVNRGDDDKWVMDLIIHCYMHMHMYCPDESPDESLGLYLQTR